MPNLINTDKKKKHFSKNIFLFSGDLKTNMPSFLQNGKTRHIFFRHNINLSTLVK